VVGTPVDDQREAGEQADSQGDLERLRPLRQRTPRCARPVLISERRKYEPWRPGTPTRASHLPDQLAELAACSEEHLSPEWRWCCEYLLHGWWILDIVWSQRTRSDTTAAVTQRLREESSGTATDGRAGSLAAF